MKNFDVYQYSTTAAYLVSKHCKCDSCPMYAKCDSAPTHEDVNECFEEWRKFFEENPHLLVSVDDIADLLECMIDCDKCLLAKENKCDFKVVKRCKKVFYGWLCKERPTRQDSRQDGLECRLLAKKVLERASKNPVDHPNHYQLMDGVEVIDIIDHILSRADLTPPQDFCLGNVIKYVLRADLKNGVEDYKKASAYLHRLINSMENGAEDGCENCDDK